MKKTMTIISLGFVLFTTIAFIPKEKINTPNNNLEYYFFIEANIEDGSYKNTWHISSILYYEGPKTCEEGYTFERKAREAFATYLKENYPVKSLRIGRTFSYKLNSSSNKLASMQDARERMNQYIADEKDDKYSVVKTDFSYSCGK